MMVVYRSTRNIFGFVLTMHLTTLEPEQIKKHPFKNTPSIENQSELSQKPPGKIATMIQMHVNLPPEPPLAAHPTTQQPNGFVAAAAPLVAHGAVVLAQSFIELDAAPFARCELRRAHVAQHPGLAALARRHDHPLAEL